MSLKRFTEEEERYNTKLARLEHGPDLVNESVQRWNSYTQEQKDAILAEGDAIYADMATALSDDLSATDPDVQAILGRWHQHLRNFYEPSIDLLRGLGETYATDERFRATFEQFHPQLPDYLKDAIIEYVDELETEALEAMIAEDEEADAARRRRLQS